MAVLNRKTCVVAGGSNTGFGDCVLSFANVVGALLVPKNKQFTPAEMVDFQTTLQGLANADNPRDRIYPIHHLDVPTDNTEELTIQTTPYGSKYPIREGDYDWSFQFFEGGMCLQKSLRSHNGSGKAVLFYDANGVIFGQKSGESLMGVPLVFFWADPWRMSDGSSATIYRIRFVFKPRYINDDLGFVETDFNPALIAGLQDVVLTEADSSARPALKITAKTGCANSDMFDWYSTELAAVAAWKATQGATDITITTVAADPNIKGWTVTLDASDTDYEAGDPVVVSLAGPTVLEGLGVAGFESRTLTIA